MENQKRQTLSQKWYNNPIIINLLLVLFFPVGLYLLWKSTSIEQWWKVTATVTIAILVIAKLSDSNNNIDASKLDSTQAKVRSETTELEPKHTAEPIPTGGKSNDNSFNSASNPADQYNKSVASNSADQYNKSVVATVNQFNPERSHARDTLIVVMKETPLYKKLVTNKEVNQKYLALLTGIGMLISSWDGETVTINSTIVNIIKQDNDQQKLLTYNIMIGARGGLTPEIVDIYYRYRDKYKYYGDNSNNFYDKNGKEERIENPYNLAIALAVFEPNNKKVLEALYESVKANNYSWKGTKNDNPEKFQYPHVLFSQSFKEHLNKVAPDSKYNFLKYNGIGTSVIAGNFEVTANDYKVTNFINTGNPYLNKRAAEGDTYLLIRATYKNIDYEGRTILSAGSLFIEYDGKEYEFDKTESILAEGFGVTFEALNPLSKKTTWLVFPIAAEIKGGVLWQPAASKEKIYLGEI